MPTKKNTTKKRMSVVVTANDLMQVEAQFKAEVEQALEMRKETFRVIGDRSIDDLAEYF